MGPCNRRSRPAEVIDRDQDEASELRRLQQQLYALAEVARVYRDLALLVLPTVGHAMFQAKMLQADTNLRDALLLVARMRRFD